MLSLVAFVYSYVLRSVRLDYYKCNNTVKHFFHVTSNNMTDFQGCWEGYYYLEWDGPRSRNRSLACNGVLWWGASGWWQGWIFYFILWWWVWLLYNIISSFLSHLWTPKYLTRKILYFVLTFSDASHGKCLGKMFCPGGMA